MEFPAKLCTSALPEGEFLSQSLLHCWRAGGEENYCFLCATRTEVPGAMLDITEQRLKDGKMRQVASGQAMLFIAHSLLCMAEHSCCGCFRVYSVAGTAQW